MERPKVTLGPIIADNVLSKYVQRRVSDCSIMTLAVAQWIMDNEKLLNENSTVSRNNKLKSKLTEIFKTLGQAQEHNMFLISNGFKNWLDREDIETSVDWDINDTTWISPIALYFSQNKGENQFYKCIEITSIAASAICQNSKFIECAKALATSIYYLSLDTYRYEDTNIELDMLLERMYGYDIPDFSYVSEVNIDLNIDYADMLMLALSYCEYEDGKIEYPINEIGRSRLSYKDKRNLYRLIITLSQACHHSEPYCIDNLYKSKDFLPNELLKIHDCFVYDFLNSEYHFWGKPSRRTLMDKLLRRKKESLYKYVCKEGTIVDFNQYV